MFRPRPTWAGAESDHAPGGRGRVQTTPQVGGGGSISLGFLTLSGSRAERLPVRNRSGWPHSCTSGNIFFFGEQQKQQQKKLWGQTSKIQPTNNTTFGFMV